MSTFDEQSDKIALSKTKLKPNAAYSNRFGWLCFCTIRQRYTIKFCRHVDQKIFDLQKKFGLPPVFHRKKPGLN